ncbi:MAG: hypothetical protein WA906_09995 [Pacificimonas sp.]
MQSKLKTWTGLGLATALAGTTLAACDGSADPVAENEIAATSGEMGEAGEGEGGAGEAGEGGEAGHDMESLPLPQRLAFMSGHVEAGLALYRAGAPEAAAPHLLHPVSETHQAERAGLADLGFEASLFEEVSAALDAGRPAAEIEPQLAAAEANLRDVRQRAGGDPAEIIDYLMDVVVEEYTIAITDGAVSDPGEYQDAWGFVVVAEGRARDLPEPNAARVAEILTTLKALWPEDAPIPPADPAPTGQISALASQVKLALP